VIGRPLFILMNNDDATVAVCNRYTGKNLPPLARMADVIVTATGKRGVINARHMKPGVIIIDAAITREGEHIVGDVKVTVSVRNRVGKITPVPGGVGPVTVATLLGAVVDLAKAHHHKPNKA
jgi:methylenetetrahydrofolate dehydrogenase (NADP+)/methenyltetrahydrofolate cyclohydrolase